MSLFLQSLDLKAQPPVWRLNLEVLEAEMAQIVGWPGTTGRFEGDTLSLTGALSHYVKPEYRDTIRSLFPKSHFAKTAGRGPLAASPSTRAHLNKRCRCFWTAVFPSEPKPIFAAKIVPENLIFRLGAGAYA